MQKQQLQLLSPDTSIGFFGIVLSVECFLYSSPCLNKKSNFINNKLLQKIDIAEPGTSTGCYPFSIQCCRSCYARLYLCQRPFYKIFVKFRNSKKKVLKIVLIIVNINKDENKSLISAECYIYMYTCMLCETSGLIPFLPCSPAPSRAYIVRLPFWIRQTYNPTAR